MVQSIKNSFNYKFVISSGLGLKFQGGRREKGSKSGYGGVQLFFGGREYSEKRDVTLEKF